MIAVVVMMCHLLSPIPDPVCHEVIVVRAEMSMMECQVGSQIAVADWKSTSVYKGEQWEISKILCASGDYQPKDAI